MLKALLIVTMLSGGDYTREFMSMNDCLKARIEVITQDKSGVARAVCVPQEQTQWGRNRDAHKTVVESMRYKRNLCREITGTIIQFRSLIKYPIPDFYGWC